MTKSGGSIDNILIERLWELKLANECEMHRKLVGSKSSDI